MPRLQPHPARFPRAAAPARAFTIVELLVVITVVAIMLALLLPSLKSARDVAQSAMCQGNLRQLGIAFGVFTTDNNNWSPPSREFPLGWNGATVAGPYWSWHDLMAEVMSPGFDADAHRHRWPGFRQLVYGQNNIDNIAPFNTWGPASLPQFHKPLGFHCPSAIDLGTRYQDYAAIEAVDASYDGTYAGGLPTYPMFSGQDPGSVIMYPSRTTVFKPRVHQWVGKPTEKILWIDVGGSNHTDPDVARLSRGLDSYNQRQSHLVLAAHPSRPYGHSLTRRHMDGANALSLAGNVIWYLRPDQAPSPLEGHWHPGGPWRWTDR